jgi:uncharacterized protein (DUF58 family)
MRRALGLGLLTLLMALAVALSGSLLILRLFYTWVLLLGISYVWVAVVSQGFFLTTSAFPVRSQVGAEIRQEISLLGTSPVPKLGIKVQAVNDLPGKNFSATLDLPFNREVKMLVDYSLRRRGCYHLGTFTLTITDPFNLFRRVVASGQSSQIIVHPQTFRLPAFKLIGLTGAGLSKNLPALSASTSSVREFASGDSLRHIHWRSTAHTGRYMVKVFDPDHSKRREGNYWVVLDLSLATQSGIDEQSTTEYAVTLASSLAREYLDNGFRFGLIIAHGQLEVIAPNSGQDHLVAILDILAICQPGASIPLSDLISRNQRLFGTESTVVIISASASTALIETFYLLNSRGCTVAYFLMDRGSFGGYSSPETGRSLVQLGAPVYVLHQTDNFRQALEQAAAGFGPLGGTNRL